MGLFKKTFTCPFCYAQHDEKDCIYRCSYNLGGNNGCCKGIQKNPDNTIPVNYLSTCKKCKEASLIRYCPSSKTDSYGNHYIIPSRCVDTSSFPIALVGAKQSGKSNYIAVLVDEIKTKMSRSMNCSLQFCDQQTHDNYKNKYYDPLFNDKMVVQATNIQDIPPLLYSINFFDDKKHKMNDSVTLSLYDTAGENFDSETSVSSFADYLSNAKGIILLLDPLQVPSIREKLQGKVNLPDQNSDSNDILTRIISSIKDKRKMKSNQIIDIPIALTFTKMDVLIQYADLLGMPEYLKHDSSYLDKGAFLMDDFSSTQESISDLLDIGMIDNNLSVQLNNFSKHAFFGISSFGENPSDGVNLSQKPHPFRVLDPLLWLLSLEKYIKTIK